MDNNLSKLILLFGVNHLQCLNSSLDSKKNLLLRLTSKTSKVRIRNFMVITSLYDDIDFKCHFRLTRSSVEILMCKTQLTQWVSKKAEKRCCDDSTIYIALYF
eukprot:XP_016658004.1 PREDICTED: uncharacterized protein LOC107883089 [Acyrthosiphon pisum]